MEKEIRKQKKKMREMKEDIPEGTDLTQVPDPEEVLEVPMAPPVRSLPLSSPLEDMEGQGLRMSNRRYLNPNQYGRGIKSKKMRKTLLRGIMMAGLNHPSVVREYNSYN